MWLPSFGKVFVFKGHWKMLSQPKSFRERETEMCALSVSSWFLSQWGAAWKQSFPPCDSHLQYIYININTQTKRFLQSWLRKHFVRLRYKYAKKRVDKGVFIERKGFQSWLKAASRKWQFPLCLRCPPRWRKTIHLGIQLIFENGSMGL